MSDRVYRKWPKAKQFETSTGTEMPVYPKIFGFGFGSDLNVMTLNAISGQVSVLSSSTSGLSLTIET